MGIIGWDGKVNIYGTDKDVVHKCKSVHGFVCGRCRQKFVNGAIGVGSGGLKFCLKCYKQVFVNILTEFNSFVKQMDETEKDIELNKEKYTAHNLACAI